MAITAHDIGDAPRLGNHSGNTGSAAFTNDAGVATDPTEATLRVKKPDGTTTVYRWPTPGVGEGALARESTGRFYVEWTCTVAGLHSVKLAGTGAIVVADQWQFFVREDMA